MSDEAASLVSHFTFLFLFFHDLFNGLDNTRIIFVRGDSRIGNAKLEGGRLIFVYCTYVKSGNCFGILAAEVLPRWHGFLSRREIRAKVLTEEFPCDISVEKSICERTSMHTTEVSCQYG